jgi:hypothetical protein
MIIKYLVYVGNKEQGEVVIRGVKANSVYRKFPYTKNTRLKVGEEIPVEIAKRLAREYRGIFDVIEEEISSEEAFTAAFKKLVEPNKDLDIASLIHNALAEDSIELENPTKSFQSVIENTMDHFSSSMNKEEMIKVLQKVIQESKKTSRKGKSTTSRVKAT